MEPGNRMRSGSWVLKDHLQHMGLLHRPKYFLKIEDCNEMEGRTKRGKYSRQKGRFGFHLLEQITPSLWAAFPTLVK